MSVIDASELHITTKLVTFMPILMVLHALLLIVIYNINSKINSNI